MSPAVGGENSYVDQLAHQLRVHGWTVEPFTRRSALSRPEIVLVHWPEFLVRWAASPLVACSDVVKVLLVISVARGRGSRLVWTAHNLQPHSVPRPLLWRAFFSVFSRQVDLVLTLTDAGAATVRGRYPRLARTPFRRVPHGDYLLDHQPVDREAARERLGWPPGPTLLMFGQLRRYKNVTGLVQAFRARPPSADARLVVAGQPREEGLGPEVERAAGRDPRIRLELRSIEHAEVAAVFGASDVVVLSYREASALNSGVALLALSLGRPVVLRSSPTAQELSRAVGPGWVNECDGTALDALDVARQVLAAPPVGVPELSDFSWDRVGELADAALTQAARPTTMG